MKENETLKETMKLWESASQNFEIIKAENTRLREALENVKTILQKSTMNEALLQIATEALKTNSDDNRP